MTKRNMEPKKTPMPEQDPTVRATNFGEVALGYTEEMARSEAERCLQCKNQPCVAGCPVNVQIPDFIGLIAEGQYIDAYNKIRETNGLPAICGRVCPQETQCEERCVRGIKGEPVGIGRLERFAADFAINKGVPAPTCGFPNGKKAAVIGSGPAGLTCAADLAKNGVDVTVFEAFHTSGGVLVYGIPEFRLPKDLVKKEIDALVCMGVKIETNMVMGRVLTIDDLKEMGFDTIFIGTGAGLPSFMNIPGESLNGVYSANEFLTRINLMKGYKFPEFDTPVVRHKKLAVVGGGNVAMDAARSAMRLGAEEVYIVYRRGMEELPARREEVDARRMRCAARTRQVVLHQPSQKAVLDDGLPCRHVHPLRRTQLQPSPQRRAAPGRTRSRRGDENLRRIRTSHQGTLFEHARKDRR